MIKGIGIDLVKNSRVELMYEKHKESFAQKILSEEELVQYKNTESKVTFLSKRFASKEAFSKAIGTGLYRDGLYPSHLTINHDDLGKPIFLIDDTVLNFLSKANAKSIYLSITDTDEITAAVVIIE